VIIREGSPKGKSETTWRTICEKGRFEAGSETERELWMSRIKGGRSDG